MHVSMRYEGSETSGVLADLKIAFNQLRDNCSNTKFFAMCAKTFSLSSSTRFVKCQNIFYQLLKSVNVTDGKKSAKFDFDKQLSASSIRNFAKSGFCRNFGWISKSTFAHANYARETEPSNVREFEARIKYMLYIQ